MDPFAKRMVQGSFIYGFVLLMMFAAMSIVYFHLRPRCNERVIGQSSSPDGKFTATLLERRCGEDAPFFSHINLRPANSDTKYGFFSGRAEDGQAFILEQDAAGAGLEFHWISADHLIISCRNCRPADVRGRLEQSGVVHIEYLIAH